VLTVTSSKGIYHEGCQQQVREVARRLQDEAIDTSFGWRESKGKRLYD